MINDKTVAVVLPAFNAARTLQATVDELPAIVDYRILVDDAVKCHTRSYVSVITASLCAVSRVSCPGSQPPPPVATGRTGPIHTRVAAEAEEILHWNDCRIRNRRQRRADELPVHLSIVEVEITAGVLTLVPVIRERPCAVANSTSPPPHGRVVVVSSGVDHKVPWIIVRLEIGCLRVVSKGKLKDGHPGKPQPLAQRFHFRRDHAEVLGRKGQPIRCQR